MSLVKSFWTLLLISVITIDLSHARPGVRVKRQDATVDVDVQSNQSNDLNPNDSQESSNTDRDKRKAPEAHFQAKNAVLGFVFGKIDSLLDTKTRLIEQLDKTNVEKNKEYNIEAPVPIRDLQSLVTAVVSPKIRAVGNLANDLTTGVLTTITTLSGGSSNGNGSNGLGNIVTKFLRFSGPILQGSSGSSTESVPDSEEDNY